MSSLVIIAIVVITAYTSAMIYAGKQIPESISQTVYVMPKAGQCVFTIVMMSVGFLLVPVLMEISAECTQFLAFLMTGGILGVGAAPLVAKEKNRFHYICAYVSGICSQLLVALNEPFCLLSWLLYVGYIVVSEDSSRNVFWAEVTCMLSIFIYCFT